MLMLPMMLVMVMLVDVNGHNKKMYLKRKKLAFYLSTNHLIVWVTFKKTHNPHLK
jgi:hypothetical protein